ncbi:MAG: DUF5050 domain-containing protein [Lachnospiraceae bacterium]|nr:DUF5050 domain-containing protein [Lachnospiraceae bacterium]
MQKRLAIILCSILVIIVAGFILQHILSAIPDNDPRAIGNTSGNLQNGGLFCEDEGIIYFSNPNDNCYLYSMNVDGSDLKCLLKAPVSYINAAGDYLYFYQEANKENGAFGSLVRTMGIYRMKKDAKRSPDCLDRTPSKVLALIGSALYYEHYETKEGITLYCVSIKGGDRHQVLPEDINPACVIDSNIYYPDLTKNFALSCYYPSTGSSHIVLNDAKVYQVTYDHGYLYYMNVADDYKLYRCSYSDRSIEKLTDYRVDTFNVQNDVIFVQKNGTDDAALIRMSADGSAQDVIAYGNYTEISMTSAYTYFRDMGEDTGWYRVQTRGGISVEPLLF